MPGLILDDYDQSQVFPSWSSSKPQKFQRIPLSVLLGGGKVANILLWRNKRVSAGILAGATVTWFLLEVVDYRFLSLLCHISMLAMLVVFIWSNAAPLFDREPPKIPEMIVSQQSFRDAALLLHAKFNRFMSFLHNVVCGKDLKTFLLANGSMWLVSEIGSYCSMLTLLYFVFLCLLTLPALYELYRSEIDHLVTEGSRYLKKVSKKIDSEVLNKIPRAKNKADHLT